MYEVELMISIPSAMNSPATALRISSSWNTASLDMIDRPLRSGITRPNIRFLLMVPAIRALRTPAFLKAPITLPSCPNFTHTISWALSARDSSVSPR